MKGETWGSISHTVAGPLNGRLRLSFGLVIGMPVIGLRSTAVELDRICV